MTEFSTLLNEMRNHHKISLGQNTRRRFIPSTPKLQNFYNAPHAVILSSEGNEAIARLKLDSQDMGQGESGEIKGGISTATEKLQESGTSNPAVDDFKKKMNEQREAAKKKSEQNIDKIYDQALAIGEKYPDTQNAILILMESIGNFFTELFDKISTFVLNVVKSVIEWLNNAWSSIKNFFGGVGSWISSWF
ncbi:hypothetical protein [Pseudomonas frederiksbergensis]|uniref:hypothetical protein n=1 Tax=Pseudomonas frederiksbergensis TaxID=104087 RepID=UPI003D25F64B